MIHLIEKTILDYLNDNLDDPALMETPSPPPDRYYLIERVGGGEEDTIRTAMLAVQSCAPTLYETVQMHEAVKAAMMDADGLEEVSRVRLNTEYSDTDTETKHYGYAAVFEVTHY